LGPRAGSGLLVVIGAKNGKIQTFGTTVAHGSFRSAALLSESINPACCKRLSNLAGSGNDVPVRTVEAN
jgi:hypothetical protein